MHWAQHTMWWHVYPLGFCGAPIHFPDRTFTPRLTRLIDWLDYSIELGTNGLLLGPIFDSGSHGYDTMDLLRIDPRLGGDAEFDALIAACKDRGIRVLLDGVFSHVDQHHPEFLRALAEGPTSAAARLFDIDWDHADGPQARVFEGHEQLVRFNHATEETAAYVRQVMTHWLDRGIDGWRLDAAYSVPPAFWAQVIPPVRERFPEAWFLGEVIHGDYGQIVADSTFDSVTEYELWKAAWSSVKERNLFELEWTLGRHNGFLDAFIPNTFIGNHDVTRVASQAGQEGAITALAVLMTVGGIPSIYYGDEQGFEAIKEERHGGDDAIRPAYPDQPEALPTAQDPNGPAARILRAHQALIGLRRRHPWLVTAQTTILELEQTKGRYRVTAADDAAYLEVSLDLTGTPTAVITAADGTVLWDQAQR